MHIRQKLRWGFLAVVLLIWAVSFISVTTFERTLERTIAEGSATLAGTTLDSIDSCIQRRLEQAQLFAENLAMEEELNPSNERFENMDDPAAFILREDRQWTSTAHDETTAFMESLINSDLSDELRYELEMQEYYSAKYGNPVFVEVFVTNRYGAIAALTQKTSDYYQADETWWQLAKTNGSYVSPVVYDQSSRTHAMGIACRIEDPNGDFAGVVKAVLNIQEIARLVKEATRRSKYDTTEVRLLDADGRVISEACGCGQHCGTLGLKDSLAEINSDSGYLIAGGSEDSCDCGCSGSGPKLVCYAHSDGYCDYPGVGWILAIEYLADEVFAPVLALKKQVFGISALVTLLAALMGLLISRSVFGPIERLRDAATEIRKGRLNTKIEITSNDEVGQLATAFQKMTLDLGSNIDKLAQSNQQLQEFTYVASHDLREPMRKISSFGKLLAESLKGQLNEDQRENLHFMIDGAERMEKLIEEMLVYSRVSTKEVSRKCVNLNETISQLESLELAIQLEESSGRIVVPEPLPLISGDPVQIRQLMQNLLSNSLKYRRPGVTPEVLITGEYRDSRTVRISIEDNGIGIKPESFKDVFVMFRRLHRHDEYQGTGIGLAVCRRIVERHGGDIGVASTYGEGSTFWFTLLRHCEAEQQPSNTDSQARSEKSPTSVQG